MKKLSSTEHAINSNNEHAIRKKTRQKKAKPIKRMMSGQADIRGNKNEEERMGHLVAIIESTEDAIISKSLTGVIRSWNKGGVKIFGYTALEAIGKHISLIIPDDLINEESQILERISNNEILDHYETVRVRKNGERVHVSLTVSPLKDPEGRIIGVSKIARDITLRKKSEAALIEANKELYFQHGQKEKQAAELVIANQELAFQNIQNEKIAKELSFANSKLAVQIDRRLKEISDYKHALDESSILAITDQKGIIKYVNDNFCNISQYSADELIGQDHRIVNSDYHSKEFIRELWVTIANGKTWRGEIQNKAKNGSIYWVDTTIIPFLNEMGKPYQYAAVRADITLRKLAEEKVKILNEELEKRVKERTEELESFSYSVSHDLRAPLRAVNGYASMFKIKYQSQFDQEANRLVNNILDNASKMGQLIDDLLTFSRLGQREMNRMTISMHEIVINLCQELNKEQGHRCIEFKVGELFPIQADNIGLKQVWLNLISNGIKYSKFKEKAIIEIGCEKKKDEIVYFIKDNGAGFDMRYVDKLFNIFQRLHSNEEFEGTGIGLAIVQRIIHKHGGRVWATGKVNEEAAFYFSLKA